MGVLSPSPRGRVAVVALSPNGWGNVLLVLAGQIVAGARDGVTVLVAPPPPDHWVRLAFAWDALYAGADVVATDPPPPARISGEMHWDGDVCAAARELAAAHTPAFAAFLEPFLERARPVGVHLRLGRVRSSDPVGTNTRRFMGEAALAAVERVLADNECFLCGDCPEVLADFAERHAFSVAPRLAPPTHVCGASSPEDVFQALAEWHALAASQLVVMGVGGRHDCGMGTSYAEGLPSTFAYSAALVGTRNAPVYVFNDGSVRSVTRGDRRGCWADNDGCAVSLAALRLVTYGTDGVWRDAAAVNACTALSSGGFTSSRVASPADLDPRFAARNAALLAGPRLGGWCVWKPHVVLQELYAARDGDLVVYCDSMYAWTGPARAWVENLLRDDDVGVVRNRPWDREYPESSHTDPAVAELLVGHPPDDGPQAWAGLLALRRSARSLQFVGAWAAWCEDPRVATGMGFADHRHDQSALSLLAKRWGLATHPVPDDAPLRCLRGCGRWSPAMFSV